MRIGFILECSPKGPDADIYPHLAKKFCPSADIHSPITLVNKANVMSEGPIVAKTLFEEGCDYVFIIWDRMPKWNGTGKCTDHIASIEAGLDALKINKSRIILCCIKDMLESWMLGDGAAITQYFQNLTTHPIPNFPDYKSEIDQSKPEEKLSRYNSKYNKYTDNFKIVKLIDDFEKIAKRNESFGHFKRSVERICNY